MGDRTVHLILTQTGVGSTIEVDGQNIAGMIRQVLLTTKPGEVTTLVLELMPRAFVVDAEGAEVGVSVAGEHLLRTLGWHPVSEDGPLLRPFRPVVGPDGSALYVHGCGNATWWHPWQGSIAEQGCDACESGPDGGWELLYRRRVAPDPPAG